jgi:gliding motility-associated-like protein
VAVIDDVIVETGGETVIVTLTGTDTAVALNTSNTATVTIAEDDIAAPSIELVKTATLSGTGTVGSIITFTFTITNTGNVPLNTIEIDDPLLSVTPITIPGILDVSAVTTITRTYTISQSDIDAGSVINSATVSGFDPNGKRVSDVSDNGNPNDGNDNPTVIKFVQTPSIAIITTAVFDDNNGDGFAQAGETVTYSFTIFNTGNVTLTNILIPNNLLGIVITGGPIFLGVGQSDSTTFTATYALTQADIILGTVTNQATVVATSPNGIVVQDKSDDLNISSDNPTVVSITGCVIEIFNAVSPNGDGDNDVFYIRGLECYPDNTVEVFNRWGVLVFERDHYNNADRAFRGVSEGRVTVNQSEELPEGTYYYVFKYKDGNAIGHQKAGYLYINRK